jgi:glycolate oxidase
MYSKSIEPGELISGEHGIDYAKKEFISTQHGEEYMNPMFQIKLAFDPQNILNPGKMCQE